MDDPLGGFVDPLSDSVDSISIADDPLLGSLAKKDVNRRQSLESAKQTAQDMLTDSLNTPWQVKKQQILTDYEVLGDVCLASSTMREYKGVGVDDAPEIDKKKVDKYSQRLASLEKKSVKENKKISMSQQEYFNHVSKLSKDLTRAWTNDERVTSLKVAIQLAKLLADTSTPQFYPSMFVMVTNQLDRFGELVYSRLKNKAEDSLNDGSITSKRKVLPENFLPADVPSVAKETCRNWFYKTACIRELLPRIYIETTLLKCYKYLSDVDFPQIFSRIGSIIRGLGDPLVALYARTYLVVVGNEVAPHLTTHALSMMQDTLFSFKMMSEPYHLEMLDKWKLSRADYVRLMSPGIEWIFKCIGRSATRDVFQGVLQAYRDQCRDSTVLKLIIDSFNGSHYAHGAMGMSALVKSSEVSYVNQYQLYAALGGQLVAHPPPEEQKIPLLNDVWKVVSKCDDIAQYIECCVTWLDLVQRHYSEREMLILLSDLSNKIEQKASDIDDTVQRRLENVVTSLVGFTSSHSTAVLTSEHLLKILDVFKGSKRLHIAKEILESFKHHEKTNDAVLINTLFDLGRALHDSVDCLSPEGERRYISLLLSSFIDKIDFGRDLEQQLNMYVECRAIFCNLDMVKDKLIICVSGLAVKAYSFMKGKHSKKTAAFSKACLAYCHITAPSIGDVHRKLQLLLLCAQVALLNQCLPQTDTFLKAAVTLIPEMPAYEEIDGRRLHTEEKLAAFTKSLLSSLIVAPGHPDHGPFYIVHGLLNALVKYPWQPTTGVQTKVYVDMLGLLITYSQRRFPYHVPHVESNDELYGGAPEYMKELGESINTCVGEIITQLTTLGERPEAAAKLNQARGLLDLVNQLASRMEVNAEVGDFLLQLLELANKLKSSFTRGDLRYMQNTVDFLRDRAANATVASNTLLIQALKAFN